MNKCQCKCSACDDNYHCGNSKCGLKPDGQPLVSPTPDSMELCKRERGTVPANCPKDTTDNWEKEAIDKLSDYSFIWSRIGIEMTPELKAFISEVRQKAVEETLRAVYGLERGSIAYYAKSKGIEL
jgi:hypothetical protein